MRVAILFLLVSVSLAGCKKSLPPGEYVNWVNAETSGLTQKIQKENYEVTVQYRPDKYMALIELGSKNATKENYNTALTNYASSDYFALKIKTLKGDKDPLMENGQAVYYERLKYFSEDIRQDIYLVQGNDTVPCMLSHLERTYKLTPFTNLLLSFDKKKSSEKDDKIIFVYDDKALGLGKITFELSSSEIYDTPEIKF